MFPVDNNGWVRARVGDILELKYGKALPEKVRDGSGYPVYGSNGIVGFHSDFLVEGQGIIIGRKGSYGIVNLSDTSFSPIDTTYYVDDLSTQPIKFWFYLLSYLPLTELNRSTAIPGLNREDAYAQVIELPPLAEQKEIADRLDILLAQVEATQARLASIPDIIKQFRQSVLAAAVSGKLTEEWRGESSYYEMDLNLEKADKSFNIPTRWSKTILSDSCTVISGNAFKSQNFLNEGQVPAIKISNVQYGQFEVKNQQFLPIEHLKIYKNFVVSEGDLLMALTRPITNDTLKVCRYPAGQPIGLLNQRVAKFIFKNESEKAFFELLFQSDYFKIQVLDKLSETLQPNLSPVDLKKFIVATPNELEQTEIVRRVEQLFAYADSIEQQAKAAKERVDNLTQAILAKAFRGELTADWRAANPDLISGDNSAEALLEKIKAERQAMKSANKKTVSKPNTKKNSQPKTHSDNSVINLINKKGSTKPQDIFDELKAHMDLREILKEISQLLDQHLIKEVNIDGQQHLEINR